LGHLSCELKKYYRYVTLVCINIYVGFINDIIRHVSFNVAKLLYSSTIFFLSEL
jgi:hypothetical protein